MLFVLKLGECVTLAVVLFFPYFTEKCEWYETPGGGSFRDSTVRRLGNKIKLRYGDWVSELLVRQNCQVL